MKKLVQFFAMSLCGLLLSLASQAKMVVVIDAGHGGKDPGAIGTSGIREKNITLAISKELKALLDADPNFKAVMTRKGDYFIQLPDRTEIARKNKANYLVSIHADSSPTSSSMKGASVWVLSNQRASDEMGKWLEDHEKQSELLGGAGSVLSNTNERYLNQTVLDLQFSHSQRSGYELGKAVLSKLSNAVAVAKSNPQHASLSVLRSPDITSILVETGYLSNPTEEKLLATSSYQRKVAQAIYNGLVAFRTRNGASTVVSTKASKADEKAETKSDSKENAKDKASDKKKESDKKDADKKKDSADKSKAENDKNVKDKKADKSDKSDKVADKKSDKKADKEKKEAVEESAPKRPEPKKSNTGFHVVQQDETLYSIARVYGTTPEKLSQLNNIKNNSIPVGKKLKVK